MRLLEKKIFTSLQINKFRNNRYKSHCLKYIILLTDGDPLYKVNLFDIKPALSLCLGIHGDFLQ